MGLQKPIKPFLKPIISSSQVHHIYLLFFSSNQIHPKLRSHGMKRMDFSFLSSLPSHFPFSLSSHPLTTNPPHLPLILRLLDLSFLSLIPRPVFSSITTPPSPPPFFHQTPRAGRVSRCWMWQKRFFGALDRAGAGPGAKKKKNSVQ